MDRKIQNHILPFRALNLNPGKNKVGGPDDDLNRTLYWLDLWKDDANCTGFNVRLLDDQSIEPGALVSFPGSGNSWLRMLLEGLTGIFVNSVYGDGDNNFRSKSKLL